MATKAILEELKSHPTEELREYYKRCFSQAEIDGVPKPEIARTVREQLNRIKTKKVRAKKPDASESECLINTSWFYEVASECGVTPESAKAESIPPAESGDTSIYTGNNEFAVNKLRDFRKAILILEGGFKNLNVDGKPLDITTVFGKKELAEFFQDVDHVIKIATNSADAKTTVPTNVHQIFKETLRVESGILNVAKIFLRTQLHMVENMQQQFITKKQSGKFIKGKEPNQLPLFKPKSREEAIFLGWYGLECKCGSWRVATDVGGTAKANNERLVCMDCNTHFDGYTVTHCSGQGSCGMLFYIEELRDIHASKKCPNPECKKPIPKLPAHLVKLING